MAASTDIAAAIGRTQRLLRRRPSAARKPDSPALARWTGGLRVITGDGAGREIVTDLPPALGGGGDALSPGWLARAGLAACAATCIAMLAVSEGLELDSLDVEARSRSDLRGLFGMTSADGPIDPGPSDVQLIVRIAAPGATPDRLRALVEAAQTISPVLSAFQLSTPVNLIVEAAS